MAPKWKSARQEDVKKWNRDELQAQYNLRVQARLHPKTYLTSITNAIRNLEKFEEMVGSCREDVEVQDLRKRFIESLDFNQIQDEYDKLMKRCHDLLEHGTLFKIAQPTLEFLESLVEKRDNIKYVI
ncbi:MAG: hypothetical protein Q9162_006271 [Coniocarpon cinnabarinum]